MIPDGSQVLGRAAWDIGFEGLKYPSVRSDRDVNIALFPEKFGVDSYCIIDNIEKLPKSRTTS